MKRDVFNLWKKLQKLEWQAYKQNRGKGVFSIPGHKIAVKVRKVVARHFSGLCLDIGCGCLPRPAYMPDGINFIGIDPFPSPVTLHGRKVRRKFPSAQAVGERLPFADTSFDCALFASSIDHFFNPGQGIAEAKRVLKPGGKLIIWYSRRGGEAYQDWKKQKGARLFNKMHQWAFTDEVMRQMVTRRGFNVLGVNKMGHKNRVLVGVKK